MKYIFIFLLGIQISLILIGILEVAHGKTTFGLTNIILNCAFGTINYYFIKQLKK